MWELRDFFNIVVLLKHRRHLRLACGLSIWRICVYPFTSSEINILQRFICCQLCQLACARSHIGCSAIFQTTCSCLWERDCCQRRNCCQTSHCKCKDHIACTFGVASDLIDLYEKVWSCIAFAPSSDSSKWSEAFLQNIDSVCNLHSGKLAIYGFSEKGTKLWDCERSTLLTALRFKQEICK